MHHFVHHYISEIKHFSTNRIKMHHFCISFASLIFGKVIHTNIHYLNPLSECILLLLKSYLKKGAGTRLSSSLETSSL